MIERYGEVITRAIADFRMAETWAAELAKVPTTANATTGVSAALEKASQGIRGHNVDFMRQFIFRIRIACEALEFPDLEPAIARVEGPLSYAMMIAVSGLPADLKALKDRFEDRLKAEWFLHVAAPDRPLYGQKELFGEKVAKKFPLALEDIEEAGNCLALGRGTACVFHLMRSMEVVVQRLCGKLSISHQEREWGKLLSDIGKAVEAMPKSSEPEKRRRNRWSETHTHLYHLKQAWRNDTMHPKKTYTQEQAREIFNATRVFMNHLAALV